MGPALEVAIGLSLMFFIIALAASAIVEFIGTVLKLRAKGLERTISTMLGSRDFVKKFFESRMITALKETESVWTIRGTPKNSTGPTPIRIPARAFADGVVDVLVGIRCTVHNGQELFKELPEDLKDVLRPMLDETENDLVALKAKLEQWFDDSMRGLGEIYKRWAKKLLFIVSLVLAVTLNASVIHVAERLWSDPITRVAVVQSADEFVTGTAENPPKVKSVDEIAKQISKLDAAQIPLGWGGLHLSATWAVLSILGWLVTALLAMLGAPFWYDAMTRLSSLRKSAVPLATNDPASATTIVGNESNRDLYGQQASKRSDPTPASDPDQRLFDALPKRT